MSVVCDVCSNHCRLREGQVGACHARVAQGATTSPDSYGRLTAVALDPIEKKPISAWRPHTLVLSLGQYGCNLHCPWCQNHSISQVGENDVPWTTYSPEEIVRYTLYLRQRDESVIGIAYTYNEPLVCYEYVRDCAMLAHREGLVNVLVSAGSVSEHVIREVAPYIDAANIDLKSARAETYRKIGGDIDAVKRTIRTLVETGCHVEICTLIVPGVNDTDEEMEEIASWIAETDPAIRLHVTRFFGCHKMADVAPTPVRLVYHLADVARSRLDDVVTGNC